MNTINPFLMQVMNIINIETLFYDLCTLPIPKLFIYPHGCQIKFRNYGGIQHSTLNGYNNQHYYHKKIASS